MRQLGKGLLRRCGYRLIRVTEPDEPISSARPEEHFPSGRGQRRGPWGFPEHFPGHGDAWLETLKLLYSRPAACPASISPEGGAMLYWIVRNAQPTTIVEVGTCLGASTIWMAAALRAVHHAGPARGAAGKGSPALHTFDDFGVPTDPRLANAPIFQDRRRTVEQRISKAGVGDLVRYHVGDSKVELVRARAELAAAGGVQLAFIDGDHTPEGVSADLLALEPVLNVGGVVVLHDVFPSVCGHTGPRALLDDIASVASGRYHWCELYTAPLNYGLAVLRRVE